MRTPRRFRPAFDCMLARIAPSTIAPVAHHVEARMLAPHHAVQIATSPHGHTSHGHVKTHGATPEDSTGSPTDPDGSGGSDPVYLDPPTGTTTTGNVA